MKILHIAHKDMYNDSIISGIKTVLEEQVVLENTLDGVTSFILGGKKKVKSIYLSGDEEYNMILNFKPDLVIFDGFWDLFHVKIARILTKNNVKYFIKPHGSFEKKSMKCDEIKKLKKIIAKKIIFDRFVKKSHGIIYLNEEEKLNSFYKHKNIFIQPNILKEIKFKNENIKDKNLLKIIYLGRIDIFQKGLDILLKVLSKNKEKFENKIFFEFYGVGKSKDIEIIKQYEKRNSTILKFNGKVIGEEKYQKLLDSDIFIHTSRFEGQPMAILEALSLNIPCIVSKGTNMKKIIQESNAGWGYDKDDELLETLILAINEYLKNKNLYKENTKKCSEKFLWKNLKPFYLNMYNKMCEIK